jgi:hypothetical protein
MRKLLTCSPTALWVLLLAVAWTAAPSATWAACGTQCGLGCPSTCYATSTSTNPSCTLSVGGVQTTCASITGSRLSTCEDACPAGYSVAAVRTNIPQCQLGYQGLQTDCAKLTGQAFTTCQDRCPDGYFPSSVRTGVFECQARYGGIQTTCSPVAGASLDTCLDSCPAGYYPASISSDANTCGTPYSGFRTHCQKVSGTALTTCEDACPSGYVPVSTSDFSNSCGGRYHNIQTQCAAVSGTSLNICGTACPDGYYTQSTRTNVSQCSVRYQGIQTVCAKNGPQASPCDATCPAGQYVSGTVADSTCIGGIRTQCSNVAGASLRTCEDKCPDGYYTSSLFEGIPQCGLRYNGIQIQCSKVAGTELSTCEDSCPAGFYDAAIHGNIPQCGGRYQQIQTVCRNVQGNLLRTCEDGCPANYYPSAVNTNVPDCAIRRGGLQVECSLVNGPDLTTCGTACPPNYYPGDVSTNFRCGSLFLNEQTACSKTKPQGPEPSILVQPKSVTITSGTFAQLTVTAAGQIPLSYQWFTGTSGDRSNPIRNATGTSVSVNPKTTTSYWVLVSNSHGEALSDTATVTVTPACIAPQITGQPRPAQVTAGSPATLSVTATGTSLSYTWYQGNAPSTASPVPGGTSTSITVTPDATTGYWVRVANACGSANSVTAVVTVVPPCVPPSITGQPRPATISAGGSAVLSVAASGTSPSYQWYEGANGDTSHPVPGGTSASVSVSPSQTTSYWVRATNACGSEDSVTATVTVTAACVPPSVTAQPQPASIIAGQTATLTVAVDGSSPAYQWYEGASGDVSRPVSGGNSPSLAISPTVSTRYWVRAFNACGSADSDAAAVTVSPACVPPSITAQPSAVAITAGQRATLTVATTGTSLSYQWYEGPAADTSRPVPGGNGPSVTVTPDVTTSYWARVSNDCGSVDSGTASVTVSPACIQPSITGQPQPVTINSGQTATLAVTAGGTSLSYQWYQGLSGDISNPVPGGAGSTLAVSPSANTFYWVRMSNDCGSADSDNALVTVTPTCVAPAIAQSPSSVILDAGQSATLSVVASGSSPQLQWYRGSSGDTSNPIPGAVGSSLVVSPSSTTSYWVRATNGCGTADSGTATVTVSPTCVPPGIGVQPQSATVTAGQPATLSVVATGTSPAYQWYEGALGDTSHPLAGGTGPSVVVTPSVTTSYWVLVSNACGSTTSVPVTVTVVPACMPPGISAQPQSVSITAGQVATLSVEAFGTAPGFQWYQGFSGDTSSPVPGGTGSAIVVSPSSTTSYWARVFNDCGFADSDTATVAVQSAGCGPDGASCGGDGHHTCQAGQCVCSDCSSGVCCGATGNSFCDGQPHFDPNTGYSGICASSLADCSSANDFDGSNAIYHDGDILACVKFDGVYGWTPRRPSPRCQEVSPVCGFVCSTHYGSGAGFQCDQNGNWDQNPPLPYCNGGVLPDGYSCP